MNVVLKVRVLVLFLSMAALAGCGGSGPKMMKVTGTATFDESPLAEGSITFRPTSAEGRPEGATIKGGKFELEVSPGAYKVEISASRPVVGGKDTGMGVPVENYIPARYNSKTELTADVKTSGPNDFKFEMRSK
ncbi:hypothetical protein [Zavarzinella formosa]|uniref:hypothetical protein n=1 Tax=Zavarzinella formosa TaxID=360055 RepID=UPI0002E28680|nr:hypothetical protein [Zavarzinella formosa]